MEGVDEMTPHPKYIQCDASFDEKLQLAAIAACLPGRPMFAEIVSVESINEGELAAILKASQIAFRERLRLVEFRCDNEGVVNKLTNGKKSGHEKVLEVRSYLKSPPKGGLWTIQHVGRTETKAADKLCRVAWKCWRQGRVAAQPVG